MLQGFTKQINAVENESSDLIIFIPKNRYFAKNKQLAYDSLSHVLNHDNLQQLNIQYIEYSETEYFSYLDTSRTVSYTHLYIFQFPFCQWVFLDISDCSEVILHRTIAERTCF